MNKEKIESLHEIISVNWQFPKHHDGDLSELHYDIKEVLDCTTDEAIEHASTFCNFMSYYATTRASGYHSLTFIEFFNTLLNRSFTDSNGRKNNYTDETGYLFVTKDKIADLIGWEWEKHKYIEDYNKLLKPVKLNPEKFYQIKIKADTHGFHFMAAYIDNGEFYIDDTSYRGIGVKAVKYITRNNFVWLSEV